MAGIIGQNDLQDAVTKLSHFTLTRYANTAACTLVVYDLLLTLDDTVRKLRGSSLRLDSNRPALAGVCMERPFVASQRLEYFCLC